MGDQGRRGWLQNLPNGPFLTAPFADDTFQPHPAGERPEVVRIRRTAPAEERLRHGGFDRGVLGFPE